jgi:hypothetical protein
MSIYKSSSLAMIPTAYKDGKLYSIRPTDGSGDFTFSRGSNLAATRVDVNGLIEKGRENLLLQSNQFDTSANWVNTSSSETSGQSGYDGSSDAWLLTKTDASGRIHQNFTASGVMTYSVYLKANASNYALIQLNGSGADKYMYIDLTNGTKGSLGGGNIDENIVDVGNGWYRCSITANTNATRVRIYPANSTGDVSATSGSIYIQDAQVEQGLVATDYIETGASTAQAGILEDMPRLDYSGSCPSLLLEPQRTNVATHSEYFGAWNTNGTASVSDNQAVSPEGVQNAALLDFGSTTLGANRIDLEPSISAGTDYVFSVFVKNIDANRIGIRNYNSTKDAIANFDFSSGSFTDTNVNVIDTIVEPYDNDWYRIGIVFNSGVDTTADMRISPDTTSGSDGEQVYIYGATLESGSYPTSYIPTYGTSQTRSFDETGNLTYDDNFNSITAFVHITGDTIFRDGSAPNVRISHTDHNNGSIRFYRSTSSQKRKISVIVKNLSGINNISHQATTEEVKFAIRYDSISGDWELFENGVSVDTATSNDYNEFDNFLLKGEGGAADLHQLVVFPTALTDSECIALTTI